MRGISLDRSIIDPADVEVLEDLIMAAVNDARAKVDQRMAEQMQKLTGGLSLPPGFKLPF
jgi:DNA-binding protein YbaB